MEKKSTVELTDLVAAPNLTIHRAVSYPKMSYITDVSDLLIKKQPEFKIPSHVKSVVIDDPHAVERWNQRVGPKTNKETIHEIFKAVILFQSNRIEVMDMDLKLAILDNEIAFAYDIHGDQLLVTTFYGRISMNPSLNHVDVLRRYNKRFDETVPLELTESELQQQTLPTGPFSVFETEDEERVYHWNFYKTKDKKMFYLCKHRSKEDDQWKQQLIDIKHVNRSKLNESQLYFLGLIGQVEFIFNYIKFFDLERHKLLYETHSKRAIHRFIDFSYTGRNRVRYKRIH